MRGTLFIATVILFGITPQLNGTAAAATTCTRVHGCEECLQPPKSIENYFICIANSQVCTDCTLTEKKEFDDLKKKIEKSINGEQN